MKCAAPACVIHVLATFYGYEADRSMPRLRTTYAAFAADDQRRPWHILFIGRQDSQHVLDGSRMYDLTSLI